MQRAAVALLGCLAVAAVLVAAVAVAVRSSRGGGVADAAVVVREVTPGAQAMAPPVGATGTSGTRGASPLIAPVVPPPAPPPVVTQPAPTVPSRALGRPNHGRLLHGVLFPAETADTTSWDAILRVSPDRDWRRVGTDRLVARVLAVAQRYRRAHPGAPRVVVQDLSLPQGGRFGPEYGGQGHASHQNGLDVDIAYPRKDRREVGVDRVGEVDRPLAQALVSAWVRAGAQYVFVGPHTGLRGPRGVVQLLANHDDHLHVRIPNVG